MAAETPQMERTLDAWRDTIAHLAGHGLTALVPGAVLDALRQRGDIDKAVAELARGAQGVAA